MTRRAGLLDGCLVATSRATGLQIGCEWVRLLREGDGLVLESRHTLLATRPPVLRARFRMDADWTPRRLEAEAGDEGRAEIDFADEAALLVARWGTREERLRVPVPRRSALVLISGGLSLPLHIAHRQPAGACGPVRYQLVPEGTCEVVPLGDGGPGDGGGRRLEMRLWTPEGTDRLRLSVDAGGCLRRFSARNTGLEVVFEETGRC